MVAVDVLEQQHDPIPIAGVVHAEETRDGRRRRQRRHNTSLTAVDRGYVWIRGWPSCFDEDPPAVRQRQPGGDTR
jgi:hypothetical protein